MATVTEPIALDRSLNTTEQTPRNLADVLAQALQMLNTTISGLNFINCVVVPSLPTTGISTTTIYLVPKSPSQQDNIYDEYINLDGTVNGWEKIGDTEIDLSNYYTKTETDTLLSGKVDKVNGKGLSTNDYTDAEKTKLAGIESGAEVNVQSDWNQTDNTADDFIKNKPSSVPISMLGTDESGRTTASQSYASGDYFYKDGYMCKALTSISAGATLTLNTNYSQSTLDDVLESKIDRSEVYNNAGSHNAIYRGKYLGSSVTAEQWASIVAGTFDDLFIGDYWTIDSVNWRIAHFDYWYRVGDTECTDHHVVIVPDSNLYNAKMNSTDITTGGYYNSEMRGGTNYLISGSSNLYTAKTKVDSAFGSAHILTHREILTNAVSSGNASGWAWYDSSVDLMSEVMVYGTLAWSVGGKGYEVGDGKGQLALFRHDISKATNRENWWLRGVHSAANFAYVSGYGSVNAYTASYSFGVRPAFAIK